jgi:hypothetical protein
MARVRIVHSKPAESGPLIEACRACGFDVEFDPGDLLVVWHKIRATIPDAIVIDLTRMPSQGRALGIVVRRSKLTRHIPLVFVDGDPSKVEAIRAQLPDASFVSRKQLCAKVKSACRRKFVNPVIPPPPMAVYSSRTAAQKLGIVAGSTVALLDPPRDYLSVLGPLPEDVELVEDASSICKVTLWFVSDLAACQEGLREMYPMTGRTKLWILWRKGSRSGLNPNLIREIAIAVGLIDYKICAVNEQWSGMAFSRRKKR